MFDDRDHDFATVVLNASLTLMSILIAVITFLVVEYKRVQADATIAEPVRKVVLCTTGVSFFAGAIAFVALIQLRSGQRSPSLLTRAFGALIAIMTLGIVYVVYIEGLL